MDIILGRGGSVNFNISIDRYSLTEQSLGTESILIEIFHNFTVKKKVNLRA